MRLIPPARTPPHASPSAAARGAFATVVCTAAFGVHAAETRTQMLVQATVLPVASFTRVQAPLALEVTARDAARGYVDVAEPTRLSVRSNGPGFVLDVHTLVPVLTAIDVYGLRGSVTLGGEGGSIVERERPAGTSDLNVRFHLVLVPGTPPGRYVWPLHLAVRPLPGR